jgi:hypothetical protein
MADLQLQVRVARHPRLGAAVGGEGGGGVARFLHRVAVLDPDAPILRVPRQPGLIGPRRLRPAPGVAQPVGVAQRRGAAEHQARP